MASLTLNEGLRPDSRFRVRDDPPFGEIFSDAIAAVEKATEKPMSDLQSPDEIAAAFAAWPPDTVTFAPALLYWLWRKGRRDKTVLCRVLLRVWRYTDMPSHSIPLDVWRKIFEITGFLSDGVARPTRRLALYRGSPPITRRGMSWTSDRWTAEKFADYWVEQHHSTERGHVYKTIATPQVVLGAIRGELTKITLNENEIEVPIKPESEYIIDARSLRITLLETAKVRLERVKREESRECRRLSG